MLPGKRVLIVDDEPEIVQLMRMRLEAHGYTVLSAADGQEALSLARQERPDAMILDLMLPKMDGFKVCRMLKFDEKYRHIVIIMLTARADKNDRVMGMSVGADAYLEKPFSPDELIKTLNDLLQAR